MWPGWPSFSEERCLLCSTRSEELRSDFFRAKSRTCGPHTTAGWAGLEASGLPSEPRALVEAVWLRLGPRAALKLEAGTRSEAAAGLLQTAWSSSELRVVSFEMRCSVDSMRYLSLEPEWPLRRLGVPGIVALLRSFSLSIRWCDLSSCGLVGCGSETGQRGVPVALADCSCLRLLLDIFRRLMRYFFLSGEGFAGLGGRSFRLTNS